MATTALAASPTHPAMALMARETRVREGAVAHDIDGVEVPAGAHCLAGDAFVMRGVDDLAFAYRPGEGITIEGLPDADPRHVQLWLHGTIYAAVAALNGLFPLHASAVAHEGRVYAFTGPTGAGKSTLVAALAKAGFAQFCDDTLLLELAADGPPTCLPGHKRLKLWPEGAALAGVRTGELVADDYAKHYVDPPAGVIAEPLPLAELIFLETGDGCAFVPISGGERIERLQDDHYTAQLWLAARRAARADRFAELAALASRITMRRFARPFDPARFAEGVAAAADHILGAERR
ncbi:MAG TPA: hypothetical protein VM055_08155 [Novosphingobium sp.]|nr:hypothetical protein [Novosphingobium sp.]